MAAVAAGLPRALSLCSSPAGNDRPGLWQLGLATAADCNPCFQLKDMVAQPAWHHDRGLRRLGVSGRFVRSDLDRGGACAGGRRNAAWALAKALKLVWLGSVGAGFGLAQLRFSAAGDQAPEGLARCRTPQHGLW